MKKLVRNKSCMALGLVLLLTLTGLGVASVDTADKVEIIILHTNDLHFHFNYREAIEAKIERIRERYENVFLLDAGDFVTRHQGRWQEPTLDWYAERIAFMINTMNELGYNAAAPGNHEFDFKDTITRDSLRQAKFPLLGANVQVETDSFDELKPYTVLNTACGRSIAVLGLSWSPPQQAGIRTLDEQKTVEQYLHLAESHDVFMLLTHIGFRRDHALAEAFDGIDLIVGGHDHMQINPAALHNGVLITQTSGQSQQLDYHRRQMLGVIRLRLVDGVLVDKEGEVLGFHAGGHTPSRLLDRL